MRMRLNLRLARQHKYVAFCIIIGLLGFSSLYRQAFTLSSHSVGELPIIYPKHYPSEKTLKSLVLIEEQCAVEFPGLTKEIEKAVAEGPFKLEKRPFDSDGLVQGRIKDGKLYIISAVHDNVLRRITAILHSLHRAIITSPSPLPDTLFALSTKDVPLPNSWSFARSDDAFSPNNPWLMPHFSSWSWPLRYIGPFDAALDKIARVENGAPWEKKIHKAVWRGTAWFDPEWNPGLRPKLIEVAGEKEWADVEIWSEEKNNTLAIEECCKYKYIIYAEGKTYSGRLPFHQACESVLITPPLTFLLHTTHLIRPLFSSSLPLTTNEDPPSKPTIPPASAYPLPSTNITWPVSYPPSLANIIFVRPDWSDLEATILYLRKNPELAKGIAQNQRELMVHGGYLSEAAEACYWRSLIRAWSKMVRTSESEGEKGRGWGEGTRWETYSLIEEIQ